MNALIKEKLALLPENPGCYLMKDKTGKIIYVGKAKILKNRVRSYFTGSHNTKTERLVSEIADFEYIVTESNVEALVLEINLIQKNKPKYNIMLKDDKSYPYLKLTNETYPKLEMVRHVNPKDKAQYYGPFPDVSAATETKKLLDRLYPLRKCGPHQKKPCLYHHMGQCTCPYYFHQDPKEYQTIVEQVKYFLDGHYEPIMKQLKQQMEDAATALDFEQAAEYRDQMSAVDRFSTQQKMTNTDLKDRDVFGYAVFKGWLCVQVFHIRQGKMIKRDATDFPTYGEPEEEVLTYIGQFYKSPDHIPPKDIYIPDTLDEESVSALVLDSHVRKPKRGEKRQLVALANKNAAMHLEERYALTIRKQERTVGATQQLGQLLHIDMPHRIESFDNSNIQGVDPVSAMVVFEDGKPNKKAYRKYKIKTVNGPDDYATMKEVLYRRYSRAIKEQSVLPDLILMDGGKGQVDVAKEIVHQKLGLSIPIAGMAKDDKHQTSELLYGDPLAVVPIDRQSDVFFLLQRIQDEVHRFAITFHRQLHQKNSFYSQLDDIEGLGPKRRQKLLSHFKSMKKIKEASVEVLIDAGMPKNVAQNVYNFFNNNTTS